MAEKLQSSGGLLKFCFIDRQVFYDGLPGLKVLIRCPDEGREILPVAS